MRHRLIPCVATLLVSLLAGSASALTLGDPAPALDVAQWVKGEPVKQLDKGKLYVVEFWATWCGPCKTSIPHLTELAHQYKDVTFIGVSVFEHDDAAVVPFVKEMGDKMDYHVATDNKATDTKGAMATTWMDAARQNGIPTAFIVGKDGRILWIGHPMGMASPLKEIIAGKYDLDAAKAAMVKRQQEEEAEAKLSQEINAAIGPAMVQKDYPAALKAIDELIAKHPENPRPLLQAKVSIAFSGKQWDAGYSALDQLAEASKDDPNMLNEMAWMVATSPKLEKRDLDRAQKYAEQGIKSSKGDAPNILDTLARVYFEKGDKAKAAETEQKAIDQAPDGEMKDDFKKSLEKYKAK